MDKLMFQSCVEEERQFQLDKWGEQNHLDIEWLGILMEEVGEAAQAINKGEGNRQIQSELIQVAAVVEAWVTQEG